MRTGRSGLQTMGMLAVALAGNVLSGCSLQPVLIGQVYNIETPPVGACPRLGWRFVVDARRAISGTLLTGGQQPIAGLSGMLAADDSFQMTATDLAGRGTADVTGRFTSLVSTISIHGDAAGRGCDGQTIQMRMGRYFSYQGGGGGGGGN